MPKDEVRGCGFRSGSLSKLKVTNSLGWSEGSSRNGETRGTTQPAQTARPQDEEDEEEGRRRRISNTLQVVEKGRREEMISKEEGKSQKPSLLAAASRCKQNLDNNNSARAKRIQRRGNKWLTRPPGTAENGGPAGWCLSN